MRKINKEATVIFFKLIEDLTEENPSKRYDLHNYWPECNGGIMAVHVERVGEIAGYPSYSVAHYYTQNGDMMRDPDMVFIVMNAKVIPASFQQDGGFPIYQESIFWAEEGWKLRTKMQKDQAIFAGQWMKNIAEQQEIIN